ncbi:hypothetical protein M899_3104 [Bacteriovorax sp. BSW11_IV]|uniref:hypothetical protein n=1 Tax=Bacteriovorax sp. BSW11_IV TaxID=1353529 RepID=UPI000389E328|nr:hypothetical protein [Bacteriovorax sp. BSW11_IV]EQC49614.1 hypothetical protein M899_3104 [Bacteriovorax sp. BSW11_IV]
MNEQKIQHIHLDFEQEAPEVLLGLLQELSLEIVSLESAQVIITDKTLDIDDKQVLCLSDTIQRDDVFKKKNHSLMSPALLNYSMGVILLKRYLGVSSSLSLDRAGIGGDVKNFTFKLSDSKSFGHYTDVLASEAIHNEFNSFKLRNYFFKQIECIEILKNASIAMYPLEVDFMSSNELFIIQSHITIQNMDTTDIRNDKRIGTIFNEMMNLSNVLDVYTLESGSKLVFCSIWLKDEMAPSFFMSQFKDFNKLEYQRSVGTNSSELKFVPTENTSENVFGFENEKISTARIGEKVKLDRVAEFIRGKKSDEELDIMRVKGYLEEYPALQKVKSLSDDDLNEVIAFVNSGKDSMLASEDEIQKIPANEVLDDFVQKIKGLSHDEADEIIRVRGSVEKPDLSQKIRAWLAPEESDVVIKNSADVIKEDVWRIKKDDIVKEIIDKKSLFEGKSLSEAKEGISDIISLNFDIPKSESNALVKDLLSLTCEEYRQSHHDERTSAFDNSGYNPNLLKLENDKLKSEIENRNKQIKRMRNLVDSMRRKIEAGTIASGIAKEIGADKTVNQPLPNEVRVLAEEVKKKDSHIESLKQSMSQLNENYDEKVKFLEEQVSELTSKLKKSVGDGNQAQNESSDLSLKLKLTEERYEVLNQKYETVKIQDKEYSEQINELRNEIREKDQNISALAGKLEELNKTSPQEMEKANNEMIEKLKASDEENKALELKYKQIEQKNKFLNGKLKDLEKKLQRAQGGGPASGGGQSNTALKQMETKHDRMKQMYDKVNTDLADRKKELHKLKTESNAMKLRITELERKLSKYEKNAA